MLFIFSTPVFIRHLSQLKTVVSLHWVSNMHCSIHFFPEGATRGCSDKYVSGKHCESSFPSHTDCFCITDECNDFYFENGTPSMTGSHLASVSSIFILTLLCIIF